MIQKVLRKHINKIRSMHYKKDMIDRKYKSNTKNTDPDVVVGSPAAIVGAGMGNAIGEGIGNALKIWKKKSSEERKAGRRLLKYKLFTVSIQYTILLLIFYMFDLFTIRQRLFQVGFFVVLPLSVLPDLYIRYNYVRKDKKLTDKLLAEFNNDSPENIDFAMNNINHFQERIRRISLLLVADTVSGSPGKAVKYSSYDPDEIGEALIKAIPEVDEESAEHLLEGINWLSRDYPTAVKPYASQFKELLKVNSTPIQSHSVDILGSIGNISSKKPAYVEAIKSAVTDDDAEVRKSAVTALGQLPCSESLKLLKKLSSDTDPAVQEQALETIEKMTS